MSKRFVGEVVQLTQNCELGQWRERAVVVKLESSSWAEHTFMTLCFFDREPGNRTVNTGADYLYLRGC